MTSSPALAVRPWASGLTRLCLRFPIRSMGEPNETVHGLPGTEPSLHEWLLLGRWLSRLHGPSPSALRSRLARTRAPAARSFNGRVYFRKVRVPRGVRRVPA